MATVSHAIRELDSHLLSWNEAHATDLKGTESYLCLGCSSRVENHHRRIADYPGPPWWWHRTCGCTEEQIEAARERIEKQAIDLIGNALRATITDQGPSPYLISDRLTCGKLWGTYGGWDEVRTEYTIQQIRRRADIALLRNNQAVFLIEVYWSHEVDGKKFEDYQFIGIDWIEVECLAVLESGPTVLEDVAIYRPAIIGEMIEESAGNVLMVSTKGPTPASTKPTLADIALITSALIVMVCTGAHDPEAPFYYTASAKGVRRWWRGFWQ